MTGEVEVDTLRRMSAGFGTGSYGTLPFGTESSEASDVASFVALVENRIRVTFDRRIAQNHYGFPGEAYDLSLYSISAVVSSVDSNGAVPRAVAVGAVEIVDEYSLDLILDRPMASWPGEYLVSVAGLQAQDGDYFETVSGTVQAVYRGIAPVVVTYTIDNRDISIPQSEVV